MLLSVSLGFITIHRAHEVSKGNTRGPISKAPGLWLIVYGIGLLFGSIGLVSVLVKVWPTRSVAMEIITGAFGAAVLAAAFVGALIGCCTDAADGAGWHAFITAIMAVGTLAALYSDWILAAIEVQGGGNWWGYPSGDVAAVYWSYFVAKRLPFFSI